MGHAILMWKKKKSKRCIYPYMQCAIRIQKKQEVNSGFLKIKSAGEREKLVKKIH